MSGARPGSSAALARFAPALALAAYVALLFAGAWTAWTNWQDLETRRELVEATAARSARLAAQAAAAVPGNVLPDDIPANAAYLTGDLLSVASADLQSQIGRAHV